MDDQSFLTRIKSAWNIFQNKEERVSPSYMNTGGMSVYRPSSHARYGSERSIVSAIYNRIAVDVSGTNIRHVKVDKDERFSSYCDSKLDYCLSIETNVDQTPRQFFMDAVLSLFEEGAIAIVPVDTTSDPLSGSFDINSMRIGKIVQWYSYHVTVEVYNERTGHREQVTLPKKQVAIVENPFYSVMNEGNSVVKRLVYKLGLLDSIDEQSSSGKLDLIIQLPYVVKTEQKRAEAEKRRKDIEVQLKGSQYGIAYTDGTEKITQLNRPVENNMLDQINKLQDTLYSQLGITEEILNGTADEKTMLNYSNRTVEPILDSIVTSMTRTFLTKTAITQHQRIKYFSNPFKLVPISQIAEIADKLTRNAILSSNDIRAIIGYRPSEEPVANELSNKNMPGSGQTDPTA